MKTLLDSLELFFHPVLIVDAGSQRIIACNEAACGLFGYGYSCMSSMALDDLLIDLPADFCQNQEGSLFNALYKTYDQTHLWAEVRCKLVHENGLSHVIVTLQDMEQGSEEAAFSETQKSLTVQWRDRYEQALLEIGSGLWELDLESGKQYASPSLIKLMGLTKSEERHCFAQLDVFEEPLKSALEPIRLGEAKTYGVEMKISQSGKEKWLSCHGRVREGGAYAGKVLVSIVKDITSFKEKDEALQRQKAMFAEVVENMPIGIWAKDPRDDFRFVIWNRKMEELFGTKKEDILGQEDYQLFESHEEAGYYRRMDIETVENGQVEQFFAMPVMTKKGEIFSDVTKIPIYRKNGDPELLFGTFEDITQKIQMKKTILRVTKAVDGSSDSVIITDEEGRAIYLNQSAKKLLGHTAESLNDSGELGDIYQEERVLKKIERTMKTGKSWKGEVGVKAANGDVVNVYARLDAILNENGKIIGMIRSHTDMTKRKKLEQEKDKINKKLKKLNKTLEERIFQEVEQNREKDRILFQQARYAQMGEMLSMIAHQWRQPLNAINGAAIDLSVSHSLGELDADVLVKNSTFIQKQAQKMSVTINDFMDFFKPGKSKEEFLLKDLIEEVHALIDAQFKHRSIHFVNQIPPHVRLVSHKKELEQVLLNIFSNARDAFLESQRSHRSVSVNFYEKNDEVAIAVDDNAGGIDESILERIFDPYFTTKPSGKGTGLGLYMCRSIIERSFEGQINACNIKNGMRFEITIPQSANEE